MADRRPPSRGPSPSEDARRRGRDAPQSRQSQSRQSRYGDDADAPWLDEAAYDDAEGPTHTLVGRRTLFGFLALIAILTIGVVVGITLVSGREDAPIDVPGVGEEIPVLASPGPWKRPPSGPDVDGIPVAGQGQVIYGTGDGEETEGAIDTSAMPEDPLPRPGTEVEVLPSVDAVLEPDARAMAPAPIPQGARPAPAPPKAVRPVDTVVPTDARTAPPPVMPKVITAPPRTPAAEPAASGSVLQLGAFSSQARARAAFKSLTDRYSYLDGLEPMIVPVEADGKTLYRLRSAAPGAAAAKDICGRLRVAGEACSVVN
jgi:cell division septation protein DedD